MPFEYVAVTKTVVFQIKIESDALSNPKALLHTIKFDSIENFMKRYRLTE